MKKLLALALSLLVAVASQAMTSAQIPAKFPIPFGNSAGPSYIRSIPVASQIGIQPGAASLTDGFPPLTFQPIASGGVPPYGQDFNGILNQITAWLWWQNAGGTVKWDSAFSASIGGYPKGALVLNAAGTGFWLSTVENNVTNPDAAGAGWQAFVANASNAVPLMDASGSAGTSTDYARADHRHPSDTSLIPRSWRSGSSSVVASVVQSGPSQGAAVAANYVPLYNDSTGTIGLGLPIVNAPLTPSSYSVPVFTNGTACPNCVAFFNNGGAGILQGNSVALSDLLLLNHDITVGQVNPAFTNVATPGNAVINKPAGSATITSGTSSIVITDSYVTTNSQVLCTLGTNDATAVLKACVAAAGSFTVYLTANATANTRVNFVVFNQ